MVVLAIHIQHHRVAMVWHLALVHHVEYMVWKKQTGFDGIKCPAYITKKRISRIFFDWIHALGSTPLMFSFLYFIETLSLSCILWIGLVHILCVFPFSFSNIIPKTKPKKKKKNCQSWLHLNYHDQTLLFPLHN